MGLLSCAERIAVRHDWPYRAADRTVRPRLYEPNSRPACDAAGGTRVAQSEFNRRRYKWRRTGHPAALYAADTNSLLHACRWPLYVLILDPARGRRSRHVRLLCCEGGA